jgi:hypothetical protein
MNKNICIIVDVKACWHKIDKKWSLKLSFGELDLLQCAFGLVLHYFWQSYSDLTCLGLLMQSTVRAVNKIITMPWLLSQYHTCVHVHNLCMSTIPISGCIKQKGWNDELLVLIWDREKMNNYKMSYNSHFRSPNKVYIK